jgi:hypothetical protein
MHRQKCSCEIAANGFCATAELVQVRDQPRLAAAALFPEMEVTLFFALPVKIKWLAWLSLAGIGWKFLQADWLERFFMLAIYSNCLIFFGPSLVRSLKHVMRRRRFRNKLGR